jgi:phosphohistidine phosphatase SixA
MLDELPASIKGVAVVGHEPTLSALVNTLLNERRVAALEKGQVIALVSDRAGRCTLGWIMEPGGGRIDPG